MKKTWNGHGLPLYWARLRAITPVQRWVAKIALPVEEEDCWEWIGAKNETGYGKFNLLGKAVRAHRFGYQAFVGPIPDGLVLDHVCRNPGCVNPIHLRAVTQRENTLSGHGIMAGFAKQSHCKRGHLFDERNTRSAKHGNGRYCRTCAKDRERVRALNSLDEEGAA